LALESGLRAPDDPVETTKLITRLSAALLTVLSAQAQGTFQNLNFEEANPVLVVTSPYYPYDATAASAFPDWIVSYDGSQQSQVFYNTESLGAAMVCLEGTAEGAIDGNYSAFLQAYFGGASISQTGLIPALTQSLFFKAWTSFPGQPLEVLIGSVSVPFTALSTGANYTLYGADVSEWAGQTEQMTFSALPDYSYPNNWMIDDISFSTNAITPEPSIVGLTAIGGLLFGARKWFARY
jgi:hypothetical protein